jgi:diguanylate cyclase (GGDEF)-like protein
MRESAVDDRALYERLLEQRRTLRFPSDIERAFRLHFLREGRPRIRLGMWTGLVLFAAYAVWDLATFPPELLAWSLPLRLLCVCPLYAAVLFVSYFRERVGLMDGLRVAAALVTAAATTLIVVVGQAHGLQIGLEGLFLVTIATYTLTGLRTSLAAACGLAVLPFELVTGLAVLGGAGAVLDDMLFSATANVVGFVACATHERTSRDNFLRTQLLRRVAAEDPLTGLANRRRFENHLGHIFPLAARGDRTVVLALVDVDHFKAFNDQHGHAAGDAALVAVARALAELSRRPLDIAARVGGEEFAIAWYDTRPEAASVLAEQISKAIASLAVETHPETGRMLTVSSGIVTRAPVTGESAVDALLAADEALYEAKAAGRDRAVVRRL